MIIFYEYEHMFIIFVKTFRMKLFLKVFFVFPLLLFADYLIMVALGCASCLLGFGGGFFCGTYCLAGKILLIGSMALFAWYISPDIRQRIITSRKRRQEV